MTIILPSARIVLAASLLAASCHTLAAEPLKPTLWVQGETYASACTAAGKKALQADLKGATVPDQEAAWRAIELMLCAPDDAQARRKLAPFLPKSGVRLCDGGTDYPSGDECRRVRRGVPDELFAHGEAWGASLEVSSDSIRVGFYPNEACIARRTLNRTGGRWVVQESAQGCD